MDVLSTFDVIASSNWEVEYVRPGLAQRGNGMNGLKLNINVFMVALDR